MPYAPPLQRGSAKAGDAKRKMAVIEDELLSDDEVLAELERAARDLGLLLEDFDAHQPTYDEVITTSRISLDFDAVGDHYVAGYRHT